MNNYSQYIRYSWLLLVPGILMAQSTRFPSDIPPDHAIILFDGADTLADVGQQWKAVGGWSGGGAQQESPLTYHGLLMNGVETRQSFQDFQLHVEFCVLVNPRYTDAEERGNSGIYIQRRYELQITDAWGEEPRKNLLGGIYKIKAPDINPARKAGEWQIFDIDFRAARWNTNQEKTANARITVFLNGIRIHDNVEIPNKTGLGRSEGPEPGPIFLQDHDNPVLFRKIWILPR